MKESGFAYIAMLVWCLTSAVAYVLTGVMAAIIEPILLCFGIFLVATVFFLFYNLKQLRSLYQKVLTNGRAVLFVNVTTLLCWYWTIYPLKYIEPAIVAATILAALPIATLLAGFVMGYKKELSRQELILSILLFMGIFFLAMIVLARKSAIDHFSSLTMLLAFLCCIGSAMALAINNIHTKRLSLRGFSPIDILSVRFWLIVILAGFLARHEIHTVFVGYLWFHVAVISASLIIIPQTIFQYALRELEPVTVSLISPLKPVLVFFFEFFNKELSLSFWSLSGIVYLTVVSIAGALGQYKKINGD